MSYVLPDIGCLVILNAMLDRASFITLATTALSSILPATIAAQAWVQPAGGYYLKLSASYLRTDEQYNPQGDIEPFATQDSSATGKSFRDVTVNAYLEYALTQRYSVVAYLPFKISTAQQTEPPTQPGEAGEETALTNGGLADLSLSIRAGLWQSSTAVAVQTGVKLPLGYEHTPDNGGPALGTGEVDVEVNILAGRSFYPFPAYIGAGVGYRVRGGADFDDEVPFSIEAGWTVGALFLKMRFDGLENIGEITNPAPGAGTMGIDQPNARNEDRYQVTPVVSYTVSDSFALTVEAYHVVGGHNTIAGTTWLMGAIFSRR
jgi:hypothetical protein